MALCIIVLITNYVTGGVREAFCPNALFTKGAVAKSFSPTINLGFVMLQTPCATGVAEAGPIGVDCPNARETKMNIRVSFMGVIAQFTGEKELTLPFNETLTLRGLFEELERRYGPDFSKHIFRTCTTPRLLQTYTRIFINNYLVDERALDKKIPFPPASSSSSEILIYVLFASCGG